MFTRLKYILKTLKIELKQFSKLKKKKKKKPRTYSFASSVDNFFLTTNTLNMQALGE